MYDKVSPNPPYAPGLRVRCTADYNNRQHQLAYTWESAPDGGFRSTSKPKSSVAPEAIFNDHCVQ